MANPSSSGSWYHRFRKRESQRSFYLALIASGMFHLSMVTVFSIVIYFPREDTRYYDFSIVPLRTPTAVAGAEAPEADTTAPETEVGGEKLALRGATLPDVELPTIEFAELERLRVGQAGSQSLSRYDEVFQEGPDDSWERFSRGLSEMSRSLTRLRLSGDAPTDPLSSALNEVTAPSNRIVHRPAEGFEAQLVWSTAPFDRQLLFAPPIEALWGADEATFQRPVELVLQVNALGRVVNVFSPTVDERELVDAIQMTTLRYRFEPLSLESGDSQTVTLRIQRDTAGGHP